MRVSGGPHWPELSLGPSPKPSPKSSRKAPSAGMRPRASLMLSFSRARFSSRSLFSHRLTAPPRRNSPAGMPTRRARSAREVPATENPTTGKSAAGDPAGGTSETPGLPLGGPAPPETPPPPETPVPPGTPASEKYRRGRTNAAMKPNPTTFPIEKRASLNVSAAFSALMMARQSDKQYGPESCSVSPIERSVPACSLGGRRSRLNFLPAPCSRLRRDPGPSRLPACVSLSNFL